jgi:hypothetical protein
MNGQEYNADADMEESSESQSSDDEDEEDEESGSEVSEEDDYSDVAHDSDEEGDKPARKKEGDTAKSEMPRKNEKGGEAAPGFDIPFTFKGKQGSHAKEGQCS